MFFLASVLGSAIDPGVILVGILVGWFSRAWWQTALAAVICGAILELAAIRIGASLGDGPRNSAYYAIEIVAVGLWAAITYALRNRGRTSESVRGNGMTNDLLANRRLWKRIAVVGAGIWMGGTVLYSLLTRDQSFSFGIGQYDSDTGLWFALVGAVLVFVVCISVPWVATTVQSDKSRT
jgi:hypothetical protein